MKELQVRARPPSDKAKSVQGGVKLGHGAAEIWATAAVAR
jgi:hypothetical protein